MKDQISAEHRATTLRIIDLAMRINNHGMYYAFCIFSGHVGELCVQIAPGTDYCSEIYRGSVYIAPREWAEPGEIDTALAAIESRLQEFLTEPIAQTEVGA